MDFKDKLSFLMGLTETKNRQLAKAITVDPSLVSRLRSGKRTPAINAEYIKSIADYFSKRLTTAFQIDAITHASGKSHSEFSDIKKSAQTIESWLLCNDSTSQSFGNLLLKSFEDIELSVSEEFAEEIISVDKPSNDTKKMVYTFYGTTGKQQATSLLLEMILTAEKSTEIKIANGNSTEWLWKDQNFSQQVSNSIKKAVLQGHTITRIIPRDQNITMSLDTVNRWLPLYSTGRIRSYYYPYHRDNVFNRTLYVAHGIAALVSTSVGYKTESGLTLLTKNLDMINSLESEFNDYLDLCLPATSFYDYENSYEDLCQCVSSFYAHQADCINIVGGLSYITTPKEVLMEFAQSSDNITPFTLMQHFDSEYSNIELLMQRYKYTEIIAIDSLEDIISGKATSCAINGKVYFYTAIAYLKQLKNIINMLEKFDNYNVFIVKEKKIESCIYIKNNYSVLGISHKSPYLVCETKNQGMVCAVWEYAKNEIDQSCSAEVNKTQVLIKIKKLILELEALGV